MWSSQTYQHMLKELVNINKYSLTKKKVILIQVIKVLRGSFIGRGETHLCIYSCPGYKCCKTGSYRHLLDRLERSKQAFSLILGVDPRPDKRLLDGNVGNKKVK